MLEISQNDIEKRLAFDNPWWDGESDVGISYRDLPRRHYFDSFYSLVTNREVNRAVILMGPRRVGKTVMLFQTIQRLLQEGVEGNRILFLSLETPIYTDTALERFVLNFLENYRHKPGTPLTIIFDEIQYLKDWEVHLKSLVDSFPCIRFIASGSAAAALRLKSRESGAGRFTEFLLPPLTFAEYLDFVGRESELIGLVSENEVRPTDIHTLNEEFVHYLNYGGYPEAVFNKTVREQSSRFIKSDIIDKVLLRDLPQLYGIRDIQELNRLFTTLAYNTGNEVTLEGLSKSSGVAKATLSRYLEYLEAAFLIRRVHRIDQNAKRFQRATSFKVYLTNPSMRAALFGAPAEDDQTMGALAETALFAQWFHDTATTEHMYYARWTEGEIDLVHLYSNTQKPYLITEVKWTDRPAHDRKMLRHLQTFYDRHSGLKGCQVTTRTLYGQVEMDNGLVVKMIPTSMEVYEVGKMMTELKSFGISIATEVGQ